MSNTIKNFFPHFLILTVICSAIYLPTSLASFQRHDDYTLQAYRQVENCRASDEYASLVRHGRILQGELLRCTLYPVYQINSSSNFFIFLRLLNLVFIIFMASMFSFWVTKVCQLKKEVSIMLATLIISLPGFQFWIGQAVAVTNTIALVIIMLSVLMLRDWSSEENCTKKTLSSFLLILITLFIYPTDALFYLLPTTALLVFTNKEKWKLHRLIAMRHLYVVFIALVFYYAAQRVIIDPTYFKLFPNTTPEGYKFVVERGVVSSVINFLKSFYYPKALSLWFITEGTKISFIIAQFLITSGVIFFTLGIIRAKKKNELRDYLIFVFQRAALLLFAYVFVQSPQIIYGSIPFYRVTVLYSAFLIILLVWAFWHWVNFFNMKNTQKWFVGILLVITYCAGHMAQWNTYKFYPFLSMLEINFLEDQMRLLLKKEVGSVTIIRPRMNIQISGDEHGMFTSRYPALYGIQGMIKKIYARNGLDNSYIDVIIGANPDVVKVVDQTVNQQADHQFIIDFDNLYYGYRLNHSQ